jgi:antitoxin MazE
MRANIIRIGNSRGIRIPKPVLEQAGLSTTVQLTVESGRLIVQPVRNPRQGWDRAFAAGAARPEGAKLEPVTNRFDQSEWKW